MTQKLPFHIVNKLLIQTSGIIQGVKGKYLVHSKSPQIE